MNPKQSQIIMASWKAGLPGRLVRLSSTSDGGSSSEGRSQSVAVSSTYNSDPVKPFRAPGNPGEGGKADEEI